MLQHSEVPVNSAPTSMRGCIAIAGRLMIGRPITPSFGRDQKFTAAIAIEPGRHRCERISEVQSENGTVESGSVPHAGPFQHLQHRATFGRAWRIFDLRTAARRSELALDQPPRGAGLTAGMALPVHGEFHKFSHKCIGSGSTAVGRATPSLRQPAPGAFSS